MAFYPSAHGTVAARIQAFQNVQTLEDLSPRFPKPPRVPNPSLEEGAVTRHGRRKESSFGSPATRASRDGVEGVRGDGRPPVGVFNHKLHPSMEQKEEYKLPSRSPSLRPSTSLANKVPDHDDPLLALSALRSPRKHRSTENIAAPQSELASIRSRLKVIAKRKERPENKPPERSLTMAELGDMIDYVQTSLAQPIDDEATTELPSEQVSGLTTPKTSMIRRWRSARASRKSLDTSTETQIHHPALQHDGVAKNRWHPDDNQRESPGRSTPSQLDIFRNTSPVKQRAAMFEKLQRKEEKGLAPHSPPERHLHAKSTWKAIPPHEPEPEIEKGLHNLKFGETIYDRSESSLAPPKSSSRGGQRQESGSSSNTSSFTTARQSNGKEPRSDHISFPEAITVEPPSRRPSAGWLPPWRLFSKGSSTTAQATQDNANAVLEKSEHHHESRPNVVQSRVQDLLLAANKHDDPAQHLTRRLTPYPGKVTQSELNERVPSPASIPSSRLAPLQVPVEEIAEALEAVEIEQNNTSMPYTPTRRSMTEKEVIDYPKPLEVTKPPPEAESIRSASPEKGSPSKTAPTTPRRGRAVRASMSPRGSGYAMEQAYIISAGRSRSRSRASGNRMIVEVEVRDSPGQEARELGQKIVYVRADVDDIDEEEEA